MDLVTNAAAPAASRARLHARIIVQAQDDDRNLPADRAKRILRRTRFQARRLDIYQHDIGTKRGCQIERSHAVRRFTDHGQVGFGSQPHVQPFLQDPLILNDQESNHFRLNC